MINEEIKYRVVIKLENSFKEESSNILYITYDEALKALSDLLLHMNKHGFNKVFGLVESVNIWEMRM